MDPKVISLDIETYGALKRFPQQRVFNPVRSEFQDKIPKEDQVVCLSITVPKTDPRAPVGSRTDGLNAALNTPARWSRRLMRALEPGITFSLTPASSLEDYRTLTSWIRHADTILGMNIQFDILYLRYVFPNLRRFLNATTHQLIDLQIVAYHESEVRPEKSLKDLGIVFATHRYDQTAKDRFDDISSCQEYCNQDVHNTLLAIPPIIRRIEQKYADTIKLNERALDWYSQGIWECIRRSENGVPFSYPELIAHAAHCDRRIKRIEYIMNARYGLQLSGPGSKKSKNEFLAKLLAMPAPDFRYKTFGDQVENHELLQRTKKTKEISLSTTNRNLFLLLLPHDNPMARAMQLWTRHAIVHKELSSYCYAMLWHRRNKPKDKQSRLIPLSPRYTPPNTDEYRERPQRAGVSRIGMAYPTWFIVPSFAKDGSGLSGGTKQVRSTCKGPAIQTMPPSVRNTMRSRWPSGKIVSYDLSQIEMRTAGLLSGDETLMRAYHKGEDLHAGLAIHCEGADIVNHPFFKTGNNLHDPRQHYKQANFLILFRGGAATLATTLLTECGAVRPIHWCQRVIDGLRTLRSGLWEWQDELIDTTHKRGYMELPIIGVSRIFMGGDKFDENEIVNTPVQSFAALVQQRFESIIGEMLGPNTWLDNAPILPLVNVYDACKFDVKSEEHERELDDIVAAAFERVCTQDIWALLQEEYGRELPITYEKD